MNDPTAPIAPPGPPPAERIWVIHTMFVPLADGTQVPAIEVDPADPSFAGCRYLPDPQGFAVAMAEAQAILTRIGGVIQIATRRREIKPNQVETLAVIIRHRSFVPLDKSQEAPPSEQDGTAAAGHEVPADLAADGAEPIAEPEPVAA